MKKSTLPPRKSRRGTDVLLIFLLLACLFPAACGKKGDPVCPAGDRPAVVTDLTVLSDPGGVVLRWSAPVGASGRETYRVYKSTLSREEGCPGCPRNFIPFRVAERRDREIFSDTGMAVLRDREVKEGNLYTYRIVHCSRRGWCSDPSALAEVLY